MTLSTAKMTALVLACFLGAASVAAAQGQPRQKTTAHHVKKHAPAAPARTAAPRGVSGSEAWMDRASGASNSGGGGGGY
jgi:hypothetical protein